MSVIKKVNVKVDGRKQYPIHYETFDSAMEVVETCRKREMTSSSFHDMARKTDFDRWNGVKSYDEALSFLRNGYQPTVDKMRKALKVDSKSVGHGEFKRTSFRNEVYGFAPVVPLALKGVPNNMINMFMRPMKAKVLDVYYDMTASCGVSSKQIIEAGQKILGAIVELEKQGYRFNLYAIQSYSDSADCDMMVVKVKDSKQPLDLRRISFPLTHTGFFRVIGFDWYSKVPDGKYRIAYGMGLAYQFTDEEQIKQITSQLFGKNAIMMQAAKVINQDKEYIKEVLSNGECKNR